MEVKNVVEFLWGSSIVTDRSDEDWLIFVDKPEGAGPKYLPVLAGPRTRVVSGTGKWIQAFPDFVYTKPFYNTLCLFAKECYMDEVAAPQISEILSMREDIARMNLREFYNGLHRWIASEDKKLSTMYIAKRASKLVKEYVLVDDLVRGTSFVEALAHSVEVATPIKSGAMAAEPAIALLGYYRERFGRKEVQDFFDKEPNEHTYNRVKSIIGSIDLTKLSGVSVRGVV